MADYIVQESDGISKFLLEDGSGALLLEVQSAAFDAALMAAMNRPWPDLVQHRATVKASGMTPSDLVNT